VYALPYARTYHPDYEAEGGVPAISEVRFSITHNRGCFGACNFCALAFHQGREVRSRSVKSVLSEAKLISELPENAGKFWEKAEKPAVKKTVRTAQAAAAKPKTGESVVDSHGCIGGSIGEHEPEGESVKEHADHLKKADRAQAAVRTSPSAAVRAAARSEMQRAVIWAEILDKPVSLRAD
jgi:hypothetical protein